MLNYTNIKRYNAISFTEYLSFDGFSHSFLKGEIFGIAKEATITENIRIGKLVDAILTEPEKADMLDELYPLCKKIAHKIKEKFPFIIHFEKQVSYTADIEYTDENGNVWIIPTKGRLDYHHAGVSVADLKVTKSKTIQQLIDFMGYKNQVWHYAKMANVSKGYIMIYSVPLNDCFLIPVDVSSSTNDFWKEKVLKFGRLKTN